MASLRRLLAPFLAALLFAQSAAAAAECLRMAGGATLTLDLCAPDGSLRTAQIPLHDPDEAPHTATFCAACHALPAAPAPPAPLAAPAAPPLPGLVRAWAHGTAWRPEAPAPYAATGPPAA
ncbi:MAG: hypothetical protein ACK4PG_05750 [Acetobacteraceae bacterium]